jgi:hypothetical protein
MPERVERFDDRGLLVTNYAHFLEIDTERGQIFGDVANVLVLGSARQDLVADHQERGYRFGSEPVVSRHNHLLRRSTDDAGRAAYPVTIGHTTK